MGVFIKEANGRVSYTDHRGEVYNLSGDEDIEIDGSNINVLLIVGLNLTVSVDQERVTTPASSTRDELIGLLSNNFFNGEGGGDVVIPPSESLKLISPDTSEWDFSVEDDGTPKSSKGNTEVKALIEEDRVIGKTGLLKGGKSQPNSTNTAIAIGEIGKSTRLAFVNSVTFATVKAGWDDIFEFTPTGITVNGFYWLSAKLNGALEFDRNDSDCWEITTLDPKQDEIKRQNNVVLSKFAYVNGAIVFAENFSNTCFSTQERADILAERFSPFILEAGLINFANETDRTLTALSGKQFRSGANKAYYGNEDNQVPDIAPISADSVLRFRGRFFDGTNWQFHSTFQDETINGNDYDTQLPLIYNNNGVISNVPNARWAVFAFYRFTGTNPDTLKTETQLLIPTQIYNNEDLAWRGLVKNGVGEIPDNLVDAVLTTVIIARGNMSNPTQGRHVVYEGDILQNIGKGATSSTTLEKAIQNSDIRTFTDSASVAAANPALESGEWFMMDSAITGLGFTSKTLLQKP